MAKAKNAKIRTTKRQPTSRSKNSRSPDALSPEADDIMKRALDEEFGTEEEQIERLVKIVREYDAKYGAPAGTKTRQRKARR